jgi:ubiquinone/menaquinone biosynthesis C-methylase UbiE
MLKTTDLMKNWLKIERIPGPLTSSYEKATRLAIDLYYTRVADEIVSSFNQGLILDLGTGPGYLPIEILKKASGINIIGVDLSRGLIRMARENAKQAGLSDRLNFEFGNSATLRFNDGAFDMVLSTGMLHSLKQPVKVFKEIYRVLKKGGQAWIYDPAQVAFYIDRNKWKASLSHRDRIFLWLFRTLKLLRPIKTYTRAQILEMLKATDFEIVSIEEKKDEIKVKLKK